MILTGGKLETDRRHEHPLKKRFTEKLHKESPKWKVHVSASPDLDILNGAKKIPYVVLQ